MTGCIRCANCRRTAGESAGGQAINGSGCTGACLYWAVHEMPSAEESMNWEWQLSDEDHFALVHVFTGINELGVMMMWQARCDYPRVPWQVRLEELQINLDSFLERLNHIESFRTALDLPDKEIVKAQQIFEVLTNCCELINEQATLVLTLTVSKRLNAMCGLTVRRVSGECVLLLEDVSEKLFTSVVCKQVVDGIKSVYRAASDCNLYTFDAFIEFYGEWRGCQEWDTAQPFLPLSDTKLVTNHSHLLMGNAQMKMMLSDYMPMISALQYPISELLTPRL